MPGIRNVCVHTCVLRVLKCCVLTRKDQGCNLSAALTKKDLTPQSEILPASQPVPFGESSVLSPEQTGLPTPAYMPLYSHCCHLGRDRILNPACPLSAMPNNHQLLPVFTLFFHRSIRQRNQSLHGFRLQSQPSQALCHGKQGPA